MTTACGWCLAFNRECCGRPECPGAPWCAPGHHDEREEHDEMSTDMSASQAARQASWEQLDSEVDAITAATPDSQEAALLKAAARGKAEVLALFMDLLGGGWKGATADDISREAGRRAAARRAGRDYRTVGAEQEPHGLLAIDAVDGPLRVWTVATDRRAVWKQ